MPDNNSTNIGAAYITIAPSLKGFAAKLKDGVGKPHVELEVKTGLAKFRQEWREIGNQKLKPTIDTHGIKESIASSIKHGADEGSREASRSFAHRFTHSFKESMTGAFAGLTAGGLAEKLGDSLIEGVKGSFEDSMKNQEFKATLKGSLNPQTQKNYSDQDTNEIGKTALNAHLNSHVGLGDEETASLKLIESGTRISDLAPKIKNLNNLFAASGKSLAEFKNFSTFYSRITNQGFLDSKTAKEIELRGAYIKAWIAQDKHFTQAQLDEAMRRKQITSKDVDASIAKHAGALAKLQAGTLQGQLSTFKGRMANFFRPVVDGIVTGAATLLARLNPMIQEWGEKFSNLITRIKPVLSSLIPVVKALAVGFASVIKPALLSTIGTVASVFKALITTFKALTGSTNDSSHSMATFVAWAKPIGKIVGTVTALALAWKGVGIAFRATSILARGNPILLAIEAITLGVMYCYGHFQRFRRIANTTMRGVAAACTWVVHAVGNIWHALGTLMGFIKKTGAVWSQNVTTPIRAGIGVARSFTSVFAGMGSIITGSLKSVGSFFTTTMPGWFKTAGTALKNAFTNAVNTVIALFHKLGSLVTGVLGKIKSGLEHIPGVKSLEGMFTSGGSLPKRASGGVIPGQGSGTSDNTIGVGGSKNTPLVRVSPGEFVVNAAAYKQNKALIEAINSGKLNATGGISGASGAVNAAKETTGDKALESAKKRLAKALEKKSKDGEGHHRNGNKKTLASDDKSISSAQKHLEDMKSKAGAQQQKKNEQRSEKKEDKDGKELMNKGIDLGKEAIGDNLAGTPFSNPLDWKNTKSLENAGKDLLGMLDDGHGGGVLGGMMKPKQSGGFASREPGKAGAKQAGTLHTGKPSDTKEFNPKAGQLNKAPGSQDPFSQFGSNGGQGLGALKGLGDALSSQDQKQSGAKSKDAGKGSGADASKGNQSVNNSINIKNAGVDPHQIKQTMKKSQAQRSVTRSAAHR